MTEKSHHYVCHTRGIIEDFLEIPTFTEHKKIDVVLFFLFFSFLFFLLFFLIGNHTNTTSESWTHNFTLYLTRRSGQCATWVKVHWDKKIDALIFNRLAQQIMKHAASSLWFHIQVKRQAMHICLNSWYTKFFDND